ncbi:probable ascorbate-specific transmembrane electron transporter 1 [Magnolia sinica]|uniref:probable ascorbate-specific transmembrane electron transporter 1 n=1 Tax=Magnolia sinica TaxID=86752 RepID=UPI002659F3C8|nr:probable ascorbate-specific transmembrane electron transporter 1 [Magnolia sinica]
MAITDWATFRRSAAVAALVAHLFGVVAVILMLVWVFHFRGGVDLNSDNEQHIFNVHPFLVHIGFTIVAGEAIMAYKIIPLKHPLQKLAHMAITLIAFVMGIVGIYAVFKYHHDIHVLQMYSLHSWTGMGTICLFGFQWLFGFLTFMYPRASGQTRAWIIRWHASSGLIIFLLAICNIQSGLSEQLLFLGLMRDKQARVMNFTGLMTILYGIAVALTVLLPQ